jgi:type IV pilus assembly protein PilA
MSCAMKKAGGFTLIELMAVVSIVSILAVIAMPVYLGYATRSKIGEGLGFAAATKTMVSEAFYLNGVVPTNNTEAGMPPPDTYAYEHISRVEVGSIPTPGAITITYRIPNLGSENLLQLIPTVENGQMNWRCEPAETNGVKTNLLPNNCRG